MSEFRKAPDGQPTESIERYLQYSKHDVAEWEREVDFLASRLATATARVARSKADITLYEWQLEQRKVSQ